jgi:hypothetical protein
VDFTFPHEFFYGMAIDTMHPPFIMNIGKEIMVRVLHQVRS